MMLVDEYWIHLVYKGKKCYLDIGDGQLPNPYLCIRPEETDENPPWTSIKKNLSNIFGGGEVNMDNVKCKGGGIPFFWHGNLQGVRLIMEFIFHVSDKNIQQRNVKLEYDSENSKYLLKISGKQ